MGSMNWGPCDYIELRYWLNITNSIDFNNSNHKYVTIGGYFGLKFKL